MAQVKYAVKPEMIIEDLNENAQVSFRQVALGAEVEYRWPFLPRGPTPGFVSAVFGVTSENAIRAWGPAGSFGLLGLSSSSLFNGNNELSLP